MLHEFYEVFNLPLISIIFTIWKQIQIPRIEIIRGFFLVKRLGKSILHYDTEFGKSILFAKRS